MKLLNQCLQINIHIVLMAFRNLWSHLLKWYSIIILVIFSNNNYFLFTMIRVEFSHVICESLIIYFITTMFQLATNANVYFSIILAVPYLNDPVWSHLPLSNNYYSESNLYNICTLAYIQDKKGSTKAISNA